MTPRSTILYFAFFLFGLIFSPRVWAWDKHQMIMQALGRTTANLERKYLYEKIKLPTPAEETEMIRSIAVGLELNERAIPVFTEDLQQKQMALHELLASSMIDEPDLGMDQDLPDSADSRNERDWMGGKTGPTSQGFRHMVFSGFDVRQPLQSLQIPLHSVGQAQTRFQKLKALSDKFFREGQSFWGVRTLLWALHYLQDLHQPFHVVQIPYWRYLPLSSIFSGFVARTTQSIGNYHYAYEGIAKAYLQHYEDFHFRDCLELTEPKLTEDLVEVILKGKEQVKDVAIPLYGLMGSALKEERIDLPRGVGEPDYYQVIRSSRSENLEELKTATCKLFQSVAQYTWGEFDRAYNYVPLPSKSMGR